MRLVDLSHPWDSNALTFWGMEPPNVYPTHQIGVEGSQTFMQRYETSMHIGTHFDAPIHIVPQGADLASVPLDVLFGNGVIVDISEDVGELGIITPAHLTQKLEIRTGDILIIHTGQHDFFTYGKAPETDRYVYRQPGGGIELANWIVEMGLRWIGIDCITPDHPMNNEPIRKSRPDLVEGFEKRMGISLNEIFPEKNMFCMHKVPFQAGITHVENIGGEIDEVLNIRCKIGAFPWKIRGGDGCICRVVAFIED